MSKDVAYSSVSKADGDEDLIEAVVLPESPVAATGRKEFAQLRAPSTLPGGYELTVELDGAHWVVLVPKLGVQEGELFHAEVLRKVESEHNGALGNPHSIPTGRWRDGLYDCCIHGCCHALCCLTYWCTPVALGQVLYRMNLSIFGNPTPRGQGVSPFKFMLALTIILNIVTHSISQAYPATFNPDGTLQDDSFWIGFNIIYAISFVLNVYIVFVIVKARYHMRRVYNIPESSGCIGCEDCCCAFWCTCCVVGQMARHTVDYTKYHPACCTDEGVDERAPPTLPVNKSGGTVQVDPQIV